MINQKALGILKQSPFGSHFMKPVYDSYSFSRIPQTFLNILMKDCKPALPSDTLPTLSNEPKQVILFFSMLLVGVFSKNMPMNSLF